MKYFNTEVPVSDYYEILGVSKSASADDIKRSYRKLALKYHPDRNKGDKASEDKFKEISEAYAVLSDPQKKQQYDMYGSTGFHQRYSTDDIFQGADFSSIFKDLNFGGGGSGFDSIFSTLFGGGAHGGGGRGGFRGQSAKGQDVEYDLTVSFMEAYAGAEKRIVFSLNNGQQVDLKVRIPAGIKEGGKLRVQGKGAQSQFGGPPGDLYIKVHMTPHHNFRRDGQNIEFDLNLKLTDAILGTKVQLPTLEGEKTVKIPAGISSGTKIRLKGLGFPIPGSSDRGDLYAVAKLEVPKHLNPQQQEAVSNLRSLGL